MNSSSLPIGMTRPTRLATVRRKLLTFSPTPPPSSVGDAAILLMVASAEIRANNFHEDGSYGFERGDIMVRRVMHFLADAAGINLHNYGGTYFLPSDDTEALALSGSVADATLRFNRIDKDAAERRCDEREHLELRARIRAKYSREEHERVTRMATEAAERWNSIPDEDPRFDEARRMLARRA